MSTKKNIGLAFISLILLLSLIISIQILNDLYIDSVTLSIGMMSTLFIVIILWAIFALVQVNDTNKNYYLDYNLVV